MMLEELQRRNYSDDAIRHHLRAVEEFSRHFAAAPDRLGLNELRTDQVYLLKTRKLAVGTVVNHVAALRFFFVRTLKRQEFRDFIPYPKEPERLPTMLSLDEVARLINASGNLFRRALLMTVYGTGMRRSEVVQFKVGDIDSKRMIIRVVQGKGSKDRDLPLNPELLETLRAYWRWRKPKVYLFPSRGERRGPDVPLSDKAVWHVCGDAARKAGISKHVTPHTLGRKATRGLSVKSRDEPACRGGGRYPPRPGQPLSGPIRIEFRLSAAQSFPRHPEVPHRGFGWTPRFLSPMRASGHLL
jgi:integrase